MADPPRSGKISAIAPQRNRRNRLSIYIDGRFAFGLDADIVAKYGLKKDRFLQQAEIETILGDAEFKRALDKAYRLLANRPFSRKELAKRLAERHYPAFIVEQVVEKCASQGYLDDQEFALQYARSRLRRRPAGRRVLQQELLRKGVDEPVISRVLDALYHEHPEAHLAGMVADKKLKSLHKLPPEQARRRLIAFLQSRGFDWEIIEQVVQPRAGEQD